VANCLGDHFSTWSQNEAKASAAWFKPFTRRGGLRQSDPFNFVLQNPSKRVAGLEYRKLDARRAAVDRQDGWLAGFMDNSFVIVQPEQSQFRACGPVIRVQNASNTQTFCDLDEHRAIFNIDYLCPSGAWPMSSASRKISASGLRIWTKQEEIKKSTNPSSLNFRIRYEFNSHASLLITTIFNP
jgi:hypothetical protein